MRWLAAGVFAGLLVSSVICYMKPRMFESSAIVASDEPLGRTVDLSPVRAEQALRLTPEGMFWAEEEEDPIAVVYKNTRITAKDGVVEISVRSTDKFLARDLALELSWLFRSMDEEESLGSPADRLPSLPEEGAEAMGRMRVVELMNGECMEAGLITDFRAIPTLVAQGSLEAKRLWESESFRRHWDYYEKATWQSAGGPGSKLPPLPLVAYPLIADMPISPNIQLHHNIGLLAGLAFGGLIGHRRSLRIKLTENPGEAKPHRIPGYAEVAPPPLPGSPEAKDRPHSPEDDW